MSLQKSESLPLVELFILSRNRPDFLLQMIESLKNQTYKNCRIIVSENSSSDIVFEQIKNIPDIEIRRRQPAESAGDHFRKVSQELQAEYFMILHDDDVALPTMVEDLVTALFKNPACPAAASNAYFLRGDLKTNELLVIDQKPSGFFSDTKALAENYLAQTPNVFPFPSYMYRRSLFDPARPGIGVMGEVSDVIFLILLLKSGPFFQVQTPLMYYRIHPGQDTHRIGIRRQISLIKWMIFSNTLSKNNLTLQYARLRNLHRQKSFKTKKNKFFSFSRKRIVYMRTFFLFLNHPSLFFKFLKNKKNNFLK